jgi:hypothetical protein
MILATLLSAPYIVRAAIPKYRPLLIQSEADRLAPTTPCADKTVAGPQVIAFPDECDTYHEFVDRRHRRDAHRPTSTDIPTE